MIWLRMEIKSTSKKSTANIEVNWQRRNCTKNTSAKRKSETENWRNKQPVGEEDEKKINFLNIIHRNSERKSAIATRVCYLGISCFTWIFTRSSSKWQTNVQSSEILFFFSIKIRNEKSLQNCNQNSIRGIHKADLLYVCEQSERLAYEILNLGDTLRRWNEASSMVCFVMAWDYTSLISSVMRLEVCATEIHTHTHRK